MEHINDIMDTVEALVYGAVPVDTEAFIASLLEKGRYSFSAAELMALRNMGATVTPIENAEHLVGIRLPDGVTIEEGGYGGQNAIVA